MNILIVSAQFPYPPRSGFSTRVYQLARQLAAQHRVTLLAYASEGEQAGVEALRQEIPVHVVKRDAGSLRRKRAAQALSLASPRPFSCRAVYSREMQRAIAMLCAQEAFDVIQLESSLLCAFPLPDGPRVVLDEHNIEYEVFERTCEAERSVPRRAFNRIEHGRFRRFERGWWSRMDGCVVTSDRELPVIRAHAPRTPVATVPNGVDLTYFRPAAKAVKARTLVFNGILTYRPNVDAAHHLVHEVWPLVLERCPDAGLTIVGRAGADEVRALSRPSVAVTGEVPDIRPYLRSASVVGVPVRVGGGTRLKVVEALAMGKAVVSTTLGCEGIAVRDREHLVIGDGAQAFADRVVELFENAQLRRALGTAGRTLIEQEYSWDFAGERLRDLYDQIGRAGRPEARDAPPPRFAARVVGDAVS